MICSRLKGVMKLSITVNIHMCVAPFFCRKETMQHALDCLARLIRLLLGPSAVADKKLECGTRLDVLGVDIKMSKRGYKCKPTKAKVQKWVCCVKQFSSICMHDHKPVDR